MGQLHSTPGLRGRRTWLGTAFCTCFCTCFLALPKLATVLAPFCEQMAQGMRATVQTTIEIRAVDAMNTRRRVPTPQTVLDT